MDYSTVIKEVNKMFIIEDYEKLIKYLNLLVIENKSELSNNNNNNNSNTKSTITLDDFENYKDELVIELVCYRGIHLKRDIKTIHLELSKYINKNSGNENKQFSSVLDNTLATKSGFIKASKIIDKENSAKKIWNQLEQYKKFNTLYDIIPHVFPTYKLTNYSK